MSCLMKRSPYTPLLKENYRRRIRMCKANMHRKKQKESRTSPQITWVKMFLSNTLGTTFISCGKDVIKIIHYGADFYPVEVNLVALPFGMYTACFYITLPAYVGCLYKRC
ncbi:unnamed protein product [Lepidochelys kempii]